jgi:hypothetical protein
MVKHYHTSENTILCKQKYKNGIVTAARFSYKISEKDNYKKCDKILSKHKMENTNKCVSFKNLGYKPDCQWRNKTKCTCIDNCAFKRALANVL